MAAALLGRGDRPGEAVFRPARILRGVAAGHGGGDLHAPARAEHRQPASRADAHQVELPGHLGRAFRDLEGRSGEDQPVEFRQGVRQGRVGIGRVDEAAGGLGGEVLHHRGVGFGRGSARGGHVPVAGRTIVAVGDEQAEHGGLRCARGADPARPSAPVVRARLVAGPARIVAASDAAAAGQPSAAPPARAPSPARRASARPAPRAPGPRRRNPSPSAL